MDSHGRSGCRNQAISTSRSGWRKEHKVFPLECFWTLPSCRGEMRYYHSIPCSLSSSPDLLAQWYLFCQETGCDTQVPATDTGTQTPRTYAKTKHSSPGVCSPNSPTGTWVAEKGESPITLVCTVTNKMGGRNWCCIYTHEIVFMHLHEHASIHTSTSCSHTIYRHLQTHHAKNF